MVQARQVEIQKKKSFPWKSLDFPLLQEEGRFLGHLFFPCTLRSFMEIPIHSSLAAGIHPCILLWLGRAFLQA